MTAVALDKPLPRVDSRGALALAGRIWFTVAVVGQWLFFTYIIGFYGPSTATGDFAAWGRNTMLIKGYVEGDTAGNIAFATHALLAGYIALGGALQLMPLVRRKTPRLHRWNGRAFLVTAAGLALSGLYLTWVRHSNPELDGAIAVSANAVLILAFGGVALAYARARRFVEHGRWAMRLYLVCNAQWFTRVGFIAFVMANGGSMKGAGAFFEFWQWGCFLVPLAALEIYFRARDLPDGRGGAAARWGAAATILALTLVMAGGVLGFTVFSFKLLSGAGASLG